MPHSLRLTILFLRIASGLTFFYLGLSKLFNPALSLTLRDHSINSLYAWLAGPTPIASVPSTVIAWIFLVVGAFITIGLFTRITSILAIILILASWLPAVSFTSFSPTQFINDDMIMVLALLVLIFGKAGHYLGLDTITRFWRRRKS